MLFTNMSIKIASPESISAKTNVANTENLATENGRAIGIWKSVNKNKLDNLIKSSHTAIPNHAQTPLENYDTTYVVLSGFHGAAPSVKCLLVCRILVRPSSLDPAK